MEKVYKSKNYSETIIPVEPFRFDIETEAQQMLKYLHENGYAVIKAVASNDEIELGKKLFWDWAERISPNLFRGNPNTWTDKNWVGDSNNGICSFINHSEFVWKTRLLPLVKKTFAEIWN